MTSKSVSFNSDVSNSSSYFLWGHLGFWNLYFLGKLGLYWSGHINFDLFYNSLFFAVLVLPLSKVWLIRLRDLIAIPFAIAILYYDTWFPPFKRLLERPEVLQFSNDYIFELLGRFISWELIGAGFIFLVAYLFLSQWLRMTFFSLLGLLSIGLAHIDMPALPSISWGNTQLAAAPLSDHANPSAAVGKPDVSQLSAKALNELLNQELANFYAAEKARSVKLMAPDSGDIPFDLLFINICSLSWSDLQEVNLTSHPLFQKMDVVFDHFNSVTSYSGPAVTRLMYATCGQRAHSELYEEQPQECSLFDNLRSLGFDTSVALNQTGEFQGFFNTLAKADPTSKPLVPTHLKPALRSFYGSPLWRDSEVLSLWLDKNQKNPGDKPRALLYNTVTLHDGNKEATADGGSRMSPYDTRATNLLNDLDSFIEELERSGRKALVVFIPEHGASLTGDKMQIPGMREIPTPEITHVPVGVKLIGANSASPAQPIHIAEPSSFLGLSDLVARVMRQDVFEQGVIDWSMLTANLPQTKKVAENEGVVIMEHDGKTYVRMQGKNWVEYKQ